MLSLAAAVNADYYARLAANGYYHQGVEPPGSWYGVGAQALGVEGQVEEKAFKELFNGFHPGTGEGLVQNAGDPGRDNAWDLTFTLPKELSHLWALGSREEQERISSLHEEAVKESLDLFQERAARSRRGKGGHIKETGVGLTFALFEHCSSREGDVLLHTHAVMMNIGVCQDRKTRALESYDFYRYKMAVGAFYRGRVARKFGEEFGIGFTQGERGTVEVLGRNDAYYRHTSKRRAAVVAQLEELGVSGGRAAAIACLDSRQRKDMQTSREELCEEWRKDAQEQFGLSFKGLLGEYQRLGREQRLYCREEVVEEVLTHLFEKYSTFDQYKLSQAVFEAVQVKGLGKEEVLSLEEEVRGRVQEIGCHKGRIYYTTERTVALERAFIEKVKEAAEDIRHVVASEVKARVLEQESLSDEQKLAFLHVTDKGALKIVEGVAGAGKTTFLKEAVSAFQQEGYQVIGLSLAADAAATLAKEAGLCEAHSVAWFLANKERVELSPKTVLIVDEAAMVGTRQLHELLGLSERAGAKNIWVGDRDQLQAIDPGGAFAGAIERIGGARLDTIYRQNEPWAREMVYSAARGEVGDAVEALAERELVTCYQSRKELQEAVLASWQETRDRGDEARNLILTATRAEAAVFNKKCQEARLKEGSISGERWIESSEGELFFVGDRVLISKNNAALQVRNGMRGVVRDLDGRTGELVVALDGGEERRINAKTFPPLSLGYAVTTHKAQGKTVQHSYIVCDTAMTSRESFYVQVSRHRESCELFVDVSQSKNREAGYQEFLSSITRTTRECLAVDFKKELRARQQKEEEARRWYPVEMRAEDLAQNIRKGALSTLEHRYESLARVYYNAPRPISEEEARRKAYEQVTGGNWQKTQDEVQELERRVNVKKAGLEDVHYHAKYHRGWVYRTFSSKYRRDVEAGERAVKDATQRFEEAKLRWQKMESSVLHGEKSKEAEGIAEKIVDDNQQAIHRAVSVRSELLRVQEQRDRMRIVVQGLELLGTEKVQCRKNGKGQLEITDRNAAHRAAKAYQLEQKRERGIGRGR